MTRTMTIDSVDRANIIPLDSFRLVTAANQGEVGVGSIRIEDTTGTLSVPAWKSLHVTDTLEAAQWERIYTGYAVNQSLSRDYMKGGVQRVIDIDTVDLNHRLDEEIIRAQTAIRPAETDVDRVTWLAGSSYLSFVTTSVIQAAGPVNMDPTDYRDGTALDVLRDCAEASGRNFFLTYDLTDLFTLFYGKTGYAQLTATWRISDNPADQDGVTLYPISASRDRDFSKVYSGVNVNFDKGSIYATASGTVTTYKQREINIQSDARTSDGAEAVATNFLDQADSDEETIRCSLLLEAANCNQYRAGYRVEVKLRALGITAFTYYRITQTTLQAMGDKYLVDLEFSPRTTTHKPVRVKLRKPRLDDETVPNSGFENGPHDVDNRINDWVVELGTAQTATISGSGTVSKPRPHGGKRTLRVEQDTLAEVWTEDFAPVAGGRRYLLRGYYNFTAGGATYGANPPQIQIAWYNASFTFLGYSVAKYSTGVFKNRWNRLTNVKAAPSTAAYRKIRIYCAVGTAGRYHFFDDVTFEQTDLAVGATVPADS